ncbi:MAG: sensor histidine kinase KdpD [candidate division Zixibacteria bacterium]|nr:sensor histidine kinase KdpD [candidate division Zixibacteria bacterium]
MPEPLRPDPDELLAAIKKDESKMQSGRLRIFFGMAAGVGKTYAMLKAAQDRLKEGVDVVIGTVDSHRRTETEMLTAGLPLIPRKKIVYKNAALEEMDIDAILARRPQLVLVDELAHTNVPGSRHPKRWHDVVELLDAGIDVYTTINVQHIESRKESVESVTGIRIRETVPDSILERAYQVILIDITPSELLKRLSEGKVYLGDMAGAAARNFFKEDRLTALREIALRLTAEKVDSELQDMISVRESDTAWKTTERLMVAVSHSPFSEGLIRATRRLAFGMEAPWIGVHVDTGIALSDQDRATLAKNLSLVRELGGEIVSTSDLDIAQALRRIARQRNVTQLIVGRPTRRRFRDILQGGTILDRLVRESGSFDVHVLRQETKRSAASEVRPKIEFESGLSIYGLVTSAVAAVALIDSLLLPLIGYRAVGFIFLLTVLAMGMFVSIGPILVAAVMSALIWDFFFIPPYGTFRIFAPEDIAMCGAYLFVAITTGTLTNRIRKRERMLRLREERTQVLYDIVRTMAAGHNRREFMSLTAEKMGATLDGECSIAPSNQDGKLERQTFPSREWCRIDREWAVAQWAFEHGKQAGWSTDTLPSADGIYIPLRGTSETVGILAYHPRGKVHLLQEEENLLSTVTRQLAISLERELLQDRSQQAERLAESEKLYQTILNSVSHEIRTPLTAIIGFTSALRSDQLNADTESRRQMINELSDSAERLNNVVTNLLDLSRLNSGMLSLKKDWHDINDLIAVVLGELQKTLSDHSVAIRSAENLPLIRIDFNLLKHALINLLSNASAYTPLGTAIELEITAVEGTLILKVTDNGPGVPAESLSHLFDKFYRVPGTPSGGTGIGLAIAKAIVEMHGGKIEAANIPKGGACFSIRLPIEKQPELPNESEGL